MICIPITAHTQAEALCEIEKNIHLADVLELRMDLIQDANLPALIAKCRAFDLPPKIIVTNRKKTEGGGLPDRHTEGNISPGEERQRVDVLKDAVKYDVDYVDIELSADHVLIAELISAIHKHGDKTKLIISHHDFQATPSIRKLRDIFQRCVKAGASVVKIVATALEPDDNIRIFDLIAHARKQEKKIIAFCMGDEGKISRVAAPVLGSYLTFASSRYGAESAPGQLTAEQMFQIMEVFKRPIAKNKSLRKDHPKVFALLGNPVEHSLSPAMHNAAFRALRINGRYLSFCVKDIASAVSGIRGLDIGGASVTIPFKVSVMPCLDKIHPDALKIGAVNTIVNTAGLLTGFNTDWQGLVSALKTAMDIEGKRIIILGAGGAARAAVFGILNEGATPMVVYNISEEAERLAQEFNCECYPLESIEALKADALINATPVGMSPAIGDSLVPPRLLKNYQLVMDVIYNPLKTKLLLDAEKAGCLILSGVDMFVHQGAEQFKLWTGQEPPRSIMRKVVLERLGAA